MHLFQIVAGVASGVLNIWATVPYLRGILAGEIRPHRVTWGVWMVLTIIAAVNQLANGGGYSAVFILVAAFAVTGIFVLSVWRGEGSTDFLDRLCLVVAVLLLAYWAVSRDTETSQYVVIIIDAIGAIPTIRKAYRSPESENYRTWILSAIGACFSALAVAKFSLLVVMYPIYVVTANTSIALAKYFGSRAALKQKTE